MSKEYKNQKAMKEKEQWAEHVLNSLSGIERAQPGDDMLERILLDLPKETQSLVLMKHVRWAIVAASVVIGFNVYVLTSSTFKTLKPSVEVESAYSLQSDFNLYAD